MYRKRPTIDNMPIDSIRNSKDYLGVEAWNIFFSAFSAAFLVLGTNVILSDLITRLPFLIPFSKLISSLKVRTCSDVISYTVFENFR